ncbi:PAS domain S-box protein [Magnetofaba australis]|uniref:PAS/PAC sensor-containing diguanylate cyclase n=1 Tax=Magnetofaba australis IT-1 TaxID=1434232 RepID=A0A1Y2K9N2_9PROT|nr:PAS domain S-box protein [Magnetofaba australis]OSM07386.1 hypothetical protein MAIT1_04718 [Magnetofaba australis IT-1]
MSVKSRLLIIYLLLIATVATGIAISFWVSHERKNTNLSVDIAGRQRMLTQLISKEILLYKSSPDEQSKRKIEQLSDLFEKSLSALQNGGQVVRGIDDASRKITVEIQASPSPAQDFIEKVFEAWPKTRTVIDNFLNKQSYTHSDSKQIISELSTILKDSDRIVHALVKAHDANESEILIVSLVFGLVGLFMIISLVRSQGFEIQNIIDQLADSQNRLDIALDTGKLGVWDIDFSTNRHFSSDREKEIYGLSSTEAHDRDTWLEQVHEQDRELVVTSGQRIRSGETQDYNLEFRIFTKNGELRWVNSVGRVAKRDAQGKALRMIGIVADVTEQKQYQENQSRLLKELNFQKYALDQHAIVTESNSEGLITYVNDLFCEVSGYSREELIGQNHRIVKSGIHPTSFYKEMWDTILKGNTWHSEVCNKRKDGSFYWVHATIVPFLDSDGDPIKFISIRTDITQRKLAEREVGFQKFALDQHAIVSIADPKGRITYINDLFCEVSGYPREELMGHDHRIVNSGTHPKEFFKNLWDTIIKGDVWHGEVCNRKKDGDLYWVNATIVPFLDEQKQPQRFVSIRTDITEQKLAEEQIRHMAMTDALTGLSNRPAFDQKLDDALKQSKRHGHNVCLLMLDLDKFKPVNDTYGHPAGDALLIAVAKRLNEHVREVDTVARLGGDEFAVILNGVTQPEDAMIVANKYVEALCDPFDLGDVIVQIGTSVGVACFPVHAQDKAELVKNADTALYAAKEAGRNTARCHESGAEIHTS